MNATVKICHVQKISSHVWLTVQVHAFLISGFVMAMLIVHQGWMNFLVRTRPVLLMNTSVAMAGASASAGFVMVTLTARINQMSSIVIKLNHVLTTNGNATVPHSASLRLGAAMVASIAVIIQMKPIVLSWILRMLADWCYLRVTAMNSSVGQAANAFIRLGCAILIETARMDLMRKIVDQWLAYRIISSVMLMISAFLNICGVMALIIALMSLTNLTVVTKKGECAMNEVNLTVHPWSLTTVSQRQLCATGKLTVMAARMKTLRSVPINLTSRQNAWTTVDVLMNVYQLTKATIVTAPMVMNWMKATTLHARTSTNALKRDTVHSCVKTALVATNAAVIRVITWILKITLHVELSPVNQLYCLQTVTTCDSCTSTLVDIAWFSMECIALLLLIMTTVTKWFSGLMLPLKILAGWY
jgi:hypothetical protein